MSGLAEKEVEYLRDRRPGRSATAGAFGSAREVPVGFRYGMGPGTTDVAG